MSPPEATLVAGRHCPSTPGPGPRLSSERRQRRAGRKLPPPPPPPPRALTCVSPGCTLRPSSRSPPASGNAGSAGARRRGGRARSCLRGLARSPGPVTAPSPRRARPRPARPPRDPGAAARGLPRRPPAPALTSAPPPPGPASARPPRVPGEERRAGGARGRRGPGAPPLGPGAEGAGAATSPPPLPTPAPAPRDARRAGRAGRGAPRRPLPGPTGGGGSGGRAPEAVPGGWASWEWHGRVPGEARGPAGPPPGERAPTCRPRRRPGDAPPLPDSDAAPGNAPGAVGE